MYKVTNLHDGISFIVDADEASYWASFPKFCTVEPC